MKNLDNNYTTVEQHIYYTHLDDKFSTKTSACFKKCYNLSPNSKEILFFTEILVCIALIWTCYCFNTYIATVEIWNNEIDNIYEGSTFRSSRSLSKEENKSLINNKHCTKNIADLLELDKDAIEKEYASLVSYGLKNNTFKLNIFGKYTPQVSNFVNQINKTIDLELLRALKLDYYFYQDKNYSVSVKKSKLHQIKLFFCKYKIFIPHIILFLGAIIASSLREPFSSVILIIMLFILITYFFERTRKCIYIVDMQRKYKNTLLGFVDY
ncbi:Plasmodium exported protein, unknown function [Plasmodium gonderi]|uniref:Uncharacterized protein n=1 Tax=Plasmodium gonderi TaxID=77519 RepID=A0A1Y1JC24_PLAGO|nr:Plasmodium exported protein, unknown function [Plasmodium gonderi]GAW80079.1 Plasmodium exported protein, unknown function [Plasmodium gonderi]